MSKRPDAPRILVSYTRPEAFVGKTREIFGRLGYRIVEPGEFAERRRAGDDGCPVPDLLIVDERRLVEATSVTAQAAAPIILLTGRQGLQGSNPRIVGAIRRPAGLHELYRLVQQIFEETPRSTLRVSLCLPARCRHGGSAWDGALVSLSDNGGLLRGVEGLPLGAHFDLSFELPHVGEIELRAEAAYQLVQDVGVVFSGIDPAARSAIGGFVSETIGR